jgi:hypothetical protein
MAGRICTLYFTMILQTAPELSVQVPAGNKTGNDIIMHTHSSLMLLLTEIPYLFPMELE